MTDIEIMEIKRGEIINIYQLFITKGDKELKLDYGQFRI